MRQSWIPTIILLNAMRTVNVQFAMPMHMYQPQPQPLVMMAPPPPPMPIPVGVPYPVPVPVLVTKKPTTTTSTTTEASKESDCSDSDSETKTAVAFPLPFGFPMPFAIPQFPSPQFCADKPRSKQCPPCPPCVCAPSCTPAFYSFCSPCHQKCRCKSNSDTPQPAPLLPPQPIPLIAPMPMPAYPPAPGPIFIFPLPPPVPFRRPPRRVSIESRSTEVSCSSSETDTYSDSDRRRRNRKHKRTVRNNRRNARISETSDEQTDEHETILVKPVLSYISKKGDVKFEKKISQDDAVRLMETDRSRSFENIRNSRRSFNNGKDSIKPVLSFISNQGDVKIKKKISADDAARLMETDRSRSFENIRNSRRSFNTGKDIIKPVLSFISNQGDVKIKKKISADDAARLMETDRSKSFENVKPSRRSFTAKKDSKKPMISYISKQGKLKFETKISEDGSAHLETNRAKSVEKIGQRFRSASKDSRTVIFSPPPNKQITNLTLSFDVV